jgi:methylenetetrahydrofolate reductase (NADPH)
MCSSDIKATIANPKIIDLLKEKKDEFFTSLEFFPPRTENGVKNLYARMDRMRDSLSPLFSDITWGAGGSTAELTMDIAVQMQKTGHVTNMHLTCTNMEKDGDPIAAVHDALQKAHDAGIRNIVALRGDPPAGEEEWKAADGGFTCALDLVKYIRKQFGEDFGIAVAGYPEGHPNAITEVKEGETMTETEKVRCCVHDGVTYVCKDEDYKKEMQYLKEKVDAGSDVIISQMFFDAETFITFVKDCREIGITCPIIPGLMCITNYNGFKKMTKFCKTRVPAALNDKVDSLKDDADGIKQFGVDFGIDISKKLLESGTVPGLHFYTLNLEKVVYGIIDGLDLSGKKGLTGDDSDEKDMKAVGSAWARVGDKVVSTFAQGTVKDVRLSGITEIDVDGWVLAHGQKPKMYLRRDSYTKLFD